MNNGEKPGRQLSRYNTHRSSIGELHKPYEHMLLKELPGAKRSNAPMHAVLESALEEKYDGMLEAQKVRNHALIHYLASLANSNNNDDIFDFDFVQSLIENGADVNSTDRNGQTIFHEVARSWNSDVALFLLEHGADLNQQDRFGRSPLHVAAAVDYADMVRFLVKHGANINIATYGEEQMPIHYAAKNDACRSLKMLLGHGANIDSRDSKNRTPLQVAAEMNRAKSAKLLVNHGAPAGIHDNMGNSALSLLIEKLPDVAIEALDQFHSVSTINRKEFFFLNYLEGNRIQDPKSPAYSALEIAVQNQEFDIILHPVMKRLIDVKWQKFGRKGAVSSLSLNLLYALLWTIFAIMSPAHGEAFYTPWSRNVWKLVIFGIVCVMTVDEMRRQITGTLKTRKRQKKWIAWRASELEEDLRFCHPRWPQEEMYLKSEIKAIRDTPLITTGDSWIYFDWFSLILILATIAAQVVFFTMNTALSRVIYARTITVLLMVLWLRIMQYARPFEGAGPFVAIFGHIFKDIINWGILTLLITIPYGCAFWITFGDTSANPVQSYSDVSSLLYLLFSMIVVNDHDFDVLQVADSTMARLLCGSYIAIMSIINLNILIALLSDTFTRVYGNAVANAVMQRAKTILFLEKSLTRKGKRQYQEFIKNFCSPESVELVRDISANNDRDEQKAGDVLKESVQEIHDLIHDRFGKHYGEGKKSDLDHIKESLEKIHQGDMVLKEKCDCKRIKRKVDVIQEILVKLSNSLKVDISEFDNDQQSSSDDDTLVAQINRDVKTKAKDRNEWSEKNEGWDYENSSQLTGLNTRSHSPAEHRFWSANKAAINEGYQFEDMELGIGSKARCSIRGRPSSARESVDHDESERPGRRSTDIYQSNRGGEFTTDDPRESNPVQYRQARDGTDGYGSRVERRQFRSAVYQTRLRAKGERPYSDTRRESILSREMPSDTTSLQQFDSRPRSSRRTSPRAELRRVESMPPRARDNISPPRRHRETHSPRLKRNSPRNIRPDSFRRQLTERRQNTKEMSRGENDRHLGSQAPRATKQQSPDTYQTDEIRDASEKYYDVRHRDPPDKAKSDADSEASESDEETSYEDKRKSAHSDNDVIQKRARRFQERRYLEDWDTRSVKSVAF